VFKLNFDSGCAEKDLPVFKNKAIKRSFEALALSFEVLALSDRSLLTAALFEYIFN